LTGIIARSNVLPNGQNAALRSQACYFKELICLIRIKDDARRIFSKSSGFLLSAGTEKSLKNRHPKSEVKRRKTIVHSIEKAPVIQRDDGRPISWNAVNKTDDILPELRKSEKRIEHIEKPGRLRQSVPRLL
jgi:hypothetical protein